MKQSILLSFLLTVLVSFSYAQNVGIGTTDPKAKLDVAGDLILKSAELILADGNTLELDITTQKFNHYKLSGPAGNFQISGIFAAEQDRIITLYNRTGHSLEIYNDYAGADAEKRILTGTGGTFAVYPGGSVTLKYDNVIDKWEITASHYNSLDNFGSGNWSLSGNDIYNANTGNVGINTMIPLTSLQVDGNLSLVSDTILTPCSSMLFNGKILIDNSVKKRSVFHILKDNSCNFNLAPDILGIAGGTDGQIVSLVIHMDNARVQHLKGLDLMPSSADSMNMIELFEPNNNGNINQPSLFTFNTGGAITLMYDGLRKRWKPINYYGEVKPAESFGWVAGGTPNSIVNPNGGNKVGIGFFNPTEQLHVGGNIKTVANVLIDGEIKPNGVSGSAGTVLTSTGNGSMSWSPIAGWTSSGNNISNNNSGNVGIGISTPFNRLHVVDTDNQSGTVRIGANNPNGVPKLLKFGDGDFVTIGENYEDDLMELKASKFFFNKNSGAPIVSVGPTSSSATISAIRGSGTDGTAAFFGTLHTSHFNYSTNEDTYIRGGKNGSKLYLNDPGGQVAIGTTSTGAAQLNIVSSRTGANANGLSINQNTTNGGNDSYGLYTYANGGGISNNGLLAESGASGLINIGGYFKAQAITTGDNKGIYSLASGSNSSNIAGHFFAENTADTESLGIRAVASGDGDGSYTYPEIQAGLFAKGIGCLAGFFDGWVIMNNNLNVYQNVICSELFENSDINMKNNISPIATSIQNILKLNPVNYYWKNDEIQAKLQTGLIAQELKHIYPELVKTESSGKLAVRYTGLIPHLIKGIQEQQSQIEALKAENESLKTVFQSQIDALKNLIQTHVQLKK